MPVAPVTRLTKKQINWLGTHRCKHKHLYIEHYNCYLQENPLGERCGYLDIECTNLNADFGFMLCYCIKVAGKDEIVTGVIDAKDIKKHLDRSVVAKCLEDLKGFDRLFTWYGAKFDIPYIKARAMIHGLDIGPVSFGQRYHKDLYYVARRNLKISSRRLENVSRLLLGKSNKTRLEPTSWTHAAMGDKKALSYVVEHCEYDVIDLERVHHKLDPLFIMRDTSI